MGGLGGALHGFVDHHCWWSGTFMHSQLRLDMQIRIIGNFNTNLRILRKFALLFSACGQIYIYLAPAQVFRCRIAAARLQKLRAGRRNSVLCRQSPRSVKQQPSSSRVVPVVDAPLSPRPFGRCPGARSHHRRLVEVLPRHLRRLVSPTSIHRLPRNSNT